MWFFYGTRVLCVTGLYVIVKGLALGVSDASFWFPPCPRPRRVKATTYVAFFLFRGVKD